MSVNKAILLGNVGKDPEVRYFDNGGAVANFTLATTNRGYTTSNGTVVPESTDWHNIVLWRGLAEFAEKYIKKGSKIYVEGRIKTRSYDDASGNKRYVTEIWGDNIELLDRRDTSRAPSVSSAPEAKPVSLSPDKEADKEDPADADDLPF